MKSRFLQLTITLLALSTRSALAEVRYVDVNGASPTPPYTNWATAATTIQDAVDAAITGDQILVANGVYQTGGRAVYGTMTNRVVVDKPLTVRSVNGPQFTVIRGHQVPGLTNGDGAVRCVYLADDATLSGFRLESGATRLSGHENYERSGGALWAMSQTAIVTNCQIIGNSACSGGGASGATLMNCTLANNQAFGPGFSLDGGMSCGGGAYGSSLDRCVLTGNSAMTGGGVARSGLRNCVLRGNSANSGMSGGGGWAAGFVNCTLVGNFAASGGGGASECSLYNSIVYYNTAPDYPDRVSCWTENSCTTPLGDFAGGSGNITNAPQFINMAGGDLRLQPNSPCVNSGNNANAAGLTDFDGNPRIMGGTVDIGAYEFQTPASVISYAWLQQYGLPINGSTDSADPDGDRMNNWQEWRADTIPTNSLSVLRLLTPTSGASGVIVSWQSVSSRNYFLERGTNLAAQPPFLLLKGNIVGQAATTTFMDTNAVGVGPFFYRVGVQE